MDINAKKNIVVTDEDLFLGVSTEIVQASDSNVVGDLLETLNVPNTAIVLGKIKRIDLIPFVYDNIPTFMFDVRAYFDRGIPEEIQMNMTIWFQELNESTQEMEIFSFQKYILLKNSEFLLDLRDIKDKIVKIDFRMGTKYYNVQEHFFKTWDLERINNSLYLYEYIVREVPIPTYQLQDQTLLPDYLKDKTTKLQESINVYRLPNINQVPLIELAEKIYIYDIPFMDNLVPESLDSTLVPEFRAGITKYLNNTLKGTLGEEQIFIRYPVDALASAYRYFVFINLTFHEITSNNEIVSSAFSMLTSMTKVPLLTFTPTVFSKEQDIYSMDIESMHLCYIKYKRLTIQDLGVRYREYRTITARPIHAGELTYSPPPLNLAGTTYYVEGLTGLITGNMGDTYYFAEQLN